ncbi:rod shape-determining protein RodA [bacterium]|nr:rod shape-determining protein RodA [bacterium]
MPSRDQHIDRPLFFSVVFLLFLGLSNIVSATIVDSYSGEFVRQLASLACGCCVFALFSFVDLKIFFRNANWLFVATLILLASVLFVGTTVNGAQRWIDLGPLGSFQPSELAKLMLILWFSRYLAGSKDGRYGSLKTSLRRFFLLYFTLAVPTILIMLQPDLGTAIVFIGVGTAMMWVSGFSWKWFSAVFLAGGLALPHFLHEYQRKRIMIFMNPDSDPTGAGWNIIQAKIAIGSGGFWGKGWMLGSQNRMNFVPEHHTDFIFTVVGEEMGFIGAFCIIVLLSCVVLRSWQLAKSSLSAYDSFLAFGLGTLFFMHTFINIGMTSGILPVVGIPLPFVSYGGTSLIVNMAALGILNNISQRTAVLERFTS